MESVLVSQERLGLVQKDPNQKCSKQFSNIEHDEEMRVMWVLSKQGQKKVGKCKKTKNHTSHWQVGVPIFKMMEDDQEM